MLEGLAVKLGMVAAAAGLIYLGVKAYGRLQRKTGTQDKHDEAHHDNDAARKRFDATVSRPLSAGVDAIVSRYRARRARRGVRRKGDGD